MKKRLYFFLTLAFIFSGCQSLTRSTQPKETRNYFQDRWETAQKALKQQEVTQAEAIFKEIYNATLTDDPQLSTKALFELALISESRGEWDTALAQFKECENKKQDLPVIKAELELPARLSGIYATLGEMKISEFYVKKTESALQVYSAQIRQDQQVGWWAETFYKIGYLPITEINNDNWISFALRFESTCQYLIRSMELADTVWSQKSFELSQSFIKKSIELMSLDVPDEDENWEIKKNQVKEKLEKLTDIVDKMQLWRPLQVEKSPYTKTFYESLKLSEAEIERRWTTFRAHAPESKESKKRNALKREGLRIITTPEEIQEIDKTQNDPNL